MTLPSEERFPKGHMGSFASPDNCGRSRAPLYCLSGSLRTSPFPRRARGIRTVELPKAQHCWPELKVGDAIGRWERKCWLLNLGLSEVVLGLHVQCFFRKGQEKQSTVYWNLG